MRFLRNLAIFALFLAYGCGDDGPGDGGPLPDVPTSGSDLPTCDAPAPLVGPDEELTSVDLDTSDGPPGPLALTECASGRFDTPQVVLEYTVPGIGPHMVTVSTVNSGTDMELDTVIAVRRGACEAPDPESASGLCFDDAADGDRRTRGIFSAEGGETVYIVVAGYFEDDRGPIQLDVTPMPNSPPTLEDAEVRVFDDTLEVLAIGMDEDGNATGVVVSLLDGTRALVDVDGDGDATESDVLRGDFDVPVTGVIRFDETAGFTVEPGLSAQMAHVRVVDAGGRASEPLVVPVEVGARVGFGEMCDAMTFCSRELQCSSGTCQATPDRAAACAAATELTLSPPAATATSASVMGVLMPGTGLFRGPCSATGGSELFFDFTVPDMPPVDLIVSTDNPGTAADGDTVLYLRRNCVDPDSSNEMLCDDDGGDALLSHLEVMDAPSGNYTAFVEAFGGLDDGETLRFELVVSLRPVLGLGQPCDPDGVLNRCASGTCSSTSGACE